MKTCFLPTLKGANGSMNRDAILVVAVAAIVTGGQGFGGVEVQCGAWKRRMGECCGEFLGCGGQRQNWLGVFDARVVTGDSARGHSNHFHCPHHLFTTHCLFVMCLHAELFSSPT